MDVSWCLDTTNKTEAFNLCIAYRNGMMQLSRGKEEETAVLVDTKLVTIVKCRWSHNSRILAVCGKLPPSAATKTPPLTGTAAEQAAAKSVLAVVFFNANGERIKTLRVPGENITDLCWGKSDLMLAMSVDAFMYFALVRHDYKCALVGEATEVATIPNYEAERLVSIPSVG